MARSGYYRNRNSKRMVYRKGGKFAKAPSLSEQFPGVFSDGTEYTCPSCGWSGRPITIEWECVCGQMNKRNEALSAERLAERKAEKEAYEAEQKARSERFWSFLHEEMTN